MVSKEKMPVAEQRTDALHHETREELARADSKATTLLGVVGILLGALLAGILAGNWTPRDLDCMEEIIFWIGASGTVVAGALLCAAVIPRLKHDRNREEVAFFGHVVQFDSKKEFVGALRKAPQQQQRLSDQIWHISHIVQRKYQLIRFGLLAFGGGLVLMTLAVGLNHF